MATCLISIGSNLGDRDAAIDSALAELHANPAISVRDVSSRHGTRAIGGPTGQGDFLNAAALLDTSLAPQDLLTTLQTLETRAGRTRNIRWESRPLDLDLLLYDDLVVDDSQLVLPHPRMAFRRFVLVPAVEIAPAMRHALLGRSLSQLLEHLDQAPNYVAITGVPGVGKSQLAKSVAGQIGAGAILSGPRTDRPLDSSAVESELILLDDRCEMLENIVRSRNEQYAISDFWLGQSLAYARELSEEDYRQIESDVAKLIGSGEVASPKLIVLVEATFDDVLGNKQTEMLQRNLRRELVESGGSPLLRLEAANTSWNEAEIIAAIQAM